MDCTTAPSPDAAHTGPSPHPIWLEAVRRLRAAFEDASRAGLEDVAGVIDGYAIELERKILDTPAGDREGVKAMVEAWLLNCDGTLDMDDGLIAAGRALEAILDRELGRTSASEPVHECEIADALT